MEPVPVPTIELHKLLFVATNEEDYDGTKEILLGYYDRKFILIGGWHCSCYGFEDTEWEAMQYTWDELRLLASQPTSSFLSKMKGFINGELTGR